MPCYFPLKGFYGKVAGASGKRPIVFKETQADRDGIDCPIRIPCGRCVGCKLERSRQWAIRCMHEKQMHQDSSFLTLTYSDEFLPSDRSLSKRDLQLFMKRLRKARGDGIRFFACGEYGEVTNRPHYHVLLFNCSFPDQSFYKDGKTGGPLYTSKAVDRLWPFGGNVIGSVTFDSCAYVARYILDKRSGPQFADWYEWVDDCGEVHSLEPEFLVMSRRPGIGLAWFKKFGAHAFEWDSVIMNGKEIRPPRYYDSKFELLDPDRMVDIKELRREKAKQFDPADATPDRRRVREQVEIAKLSRFKRDT
ncbi:replication initiator protein [Blackfly microvirus SF02]|uniref:Replication initiator protein n=1 Tax=Blackfly microvirus SF02 TaxID=2576452 RepID=A0A4P8PKB6_9VIRU|nr:replication initiator protein [Blackfly microvirus SF02]